MIPKTIPKTIRQILDGTPAGMIPDDLTLDQLAAVDPRSYTRCVARIDGLVNQESIELNPLQAYDLAKMNIILRDTETRALSKEEFFDLSNRLGDCPEPLRRECAPGNYMPSSVARDAKYDIR